MINVSKAFYEELYSNDNRNYTERVEITLSDSTKLTLNKSDLWNNGIAIEDAISSEDHFDIGAAIINKCTITINNLYDKFSQYDFTDAKVVPYIGLVLPDGTTEEFSKGEFTVDEPKYNSSIITLSCLDNMHLFDKDYSESSLVYPATLSQIVVEACQTCGVTLGTTNFPHSDFIVNSSPATDAVTFREVISWCAQIAGCFARCNRNGDLEIGWFNQEILDMGILDGGNFIDESDGYYGNGDTISGGSFNPWNTNGMIDSGSFDDLSGAHHIYSNYTIDVSTDDVVITGVKVVEKTDSAENNYMQTYMVGNAGYVISVEDNNLIQDGAGATVANWLGTAMIGLRFRKATVTHLNDPTIEAGDIATLTDRKQNSYKILVSSTKFQVGRNQRTVSAAETPARNSTTRYSQTTKNYVEYRKGLTKEKTEREEAQEELKDRIENSPGLYTTEIENPSGGVTFYMHNRPDLDDSNIIWRMTAEAWGVSTDGGESYNAGMTVDGDTIVRILTATGVNADWINTGTMSADRINGGTLTVGGSNNTNGVIRILNSSGTEVGRWDNAGIQATAGTIANWTIRNDAFFNGISYTGQQNSNSTGLGNYGGGWAFWAGNGKFSVTQAGKVFANDAEITGTVTANAGSFNSISINGAQIYSSTLQNTTTNSGTISGGTFSNGNISGGTLSGSTGGSYVGSCSGSNLNSCSLNGTSLSFGRGTTYVTAESSNVSWLYGNSMSYMRTAYGWISTGESGGTSVSGSLNVSGNLFVGGSGKERVIKTKNFGNRCLTAFETPVPTFADYGTAEIDENGDCFIWIDPIFAETINDTFVPTVFLTKLGEGDVWVDKNSISAHHVLVHGTPGLYFSWEVRYKQTGIFDERIATMEMIDNMPVNVDYQPAAQFEIETSTTDYEASANDYLVNEKYSAVNYEIESNIYFTEYEKNSINYGDEGTEYFEEFERSLLVA